METFSFLDRDRNLSLYRELSDLAKALFRTSDCLVNSGHALGINEDATKISVREWWLQQGELSIGFGTKTDLFLIYQRVREDALDNLRSFASRTEDHLVRGLFSLAEELRLERALTASRPGMKRTFLKRRQHLTRVCRHGAPKHQEKLSSSQLVSLAYMAIVQGKQEMQLWDDRTIDLQRGQFIGLRDEDESLHWARQVSSQLRKNVAYDLPHFFFEPIHVLSQPEDQPLQSRGNELADKAEEKTRTKAEHSESLQSWHQKTSSESTPTGQMNAEEGKVSKSAEGPARLSDDQVDNVDIIQARTMSKENRMTSDPSRFGDETEDRGENQGHLQKQDHGLSFTWKTVLLQSDAPSRYQNLVEDTCSDIERLRRWLERHLRRRQEEFSAPQFSGRLRPDLVNLWLTADDLRWFYRRGDSPRYHACFYVLVDCSASMTERFADVKRALTLLHEVFRSLGIPHCISGFTEEESKERTETVFLEVIPFDDFRNTEHSPRIAALEPGLDNRDGTAIRISTTTLMRRLEPEKFLFILSDAEPSAEGYELEAVLDTADAVRECRKRGISVTHFLLGSRDSNVQNLRQIYGNDNVFIPDSHDLGDRLVHRLEHILRAH